MIPGQNCFEKGMSETFTSYDMNMTMDKALQMSIKYVIMKIPRYQLLNIDLINTISEALFCCCKALDPSGQENNRLKWSYTNHVQGTALRFPRMAPSQSQTMVANCQPPS